MTDEYRLTVTRRLVNAVTATMTRLGVGPGRVHLLTAVGRRTGRHRTVPVALVSRDGARWLVSPYGERPWVLNARAAGRVDLRRGRRRETVSLHEVDAETAAPVLRDYLEQNAIVRPYFGAGPESPLQEFAAEAHRHPVFRLEAE